MEKFAKLVRSLPACNKGALWALTPPYLLEDAEGKGRTFEYAVTATLDDSYLWEDYDAAVQHPVDALLVQLGVKKIPANGPALTVITLCDNPDAPTIPELDDPRVLTGMAVNPEHPAGTVKTTPCATATAAFALLGYTAAVALGERELHGDIPEGL